MRSSDFVLKEYKIGIIELLYINDTIINGDFKFLLTS